MTRSTTLRLSLSLLFAVSAFAGCKREPPQPAPKPEAPVATPAAEPPDQPPAA